MYVFAIVTSSSHFECSSYAVLERPTLTLHPSAKRVLWSEAIDFLRVMIARGVRRLCFRHPVHAWGSPTLIQKNCSRDSLVRTCCFFRVYIQLARLYLRS